MLPGNPYSVCVDDHNVLKVVCVGNETVNSLKLKAFSPSLCFQSPAFCLGNLAYNEPCRLRRLREFVEYSESCVRTPLCFGNPGSVLLGTRSTYPIHLQCFLLQARFSTLHFPSLLCTHYTGHLLLGGLDLRLILSSSSSPPLPIVPYISHE